MSRKQVSAIGIKPDAIAYRLKSGAWQLAYPNVYRMAGTAPTWEGDLLAAQLWGGPGTVISHESAGALFGLDGVPQGVVAITSRRSVAPEGITLHRSGNLRRWEHGLLHPFNVTGIVRTLFDLGSVLAPAQLAVAFEDALRRDDERFELLRRRLDQSGLRGRPAVQALAQLVHSRDPGAAVAGSAPEVFLERLIVSAGLPPPVRQFEVKIGGKTYRIDFSYPSIKLAIEFDGFTWHWGRKKWRYDLARSNQLMLLGWRVLHVTWDDLVNHPDKVVAQIREALGM
ncbi:MAG TPA: DUF559 domain-containing protein [Actinomycetota bacterium]|nr:DUF559 domain-containing protein [Actinomycetota bacterium]